MVVRGQLLEACERSEQLRAQARVALVATRQLAALPVVPQAVQDVTEQLQDVVTLISQVCDQLETLAASNGDDSQGRG